MERGWVERPGGARLAYQVDGPENAAGLILLQGQANTHHWWDLLRVTFAERFRTVTFDYRGTGDSQWPAADGAWSTASFADDAVGVLDALGRDRVFVYGTSMGGRVAQMLAIRHPSRVAKLVLACTSPGGSIGRERSQEVRRELAQSDPQARRQALLNFMYTPAWATAYGDSSTLLGDPSMTAEATRRHLRVSGEHDASEHLSIIAAPTLILHGSDDLMAPVENATLIAERIPGALVSITQGGRHGFFDEFAASVTPEILGFLD